MADADILRMIEQLESWAPVHIRSIETLEQARKKVLDELRTMADFLRDKKLRDGSKLNYLIGDVVDLVQDIVDLSTDLSEYFLGAAEIEHNILVTWHWLRQTRMRMIKSGVGEGDEEDEGEGDGDEEVVGLEEDVQVLLRRAIFNEKESLSTSLVKGMAGIGKTALARQVYDHPAIVDRFKHSAWVSLSSDSTIREVLMEMIQQVVGSEELRRDSLLEKMEHADKKSLQQMLRQHLQGMAYFIVVDNVPKDMFHLTSIEKCHPDEDNGSRLLLTSRSRDCTDGIDYMHEMKALDPDKSWKLFVKIINKFTSDEEQYKFPRHLEKRGKKMITKCGGLPAAIIDVGRQKAKERVCKGIEWEELLEIDSIDLGASLELLESSYRQLDEQLQARFMYLAFFKENVIIRAAKLGHIWSAGGGFGKKYATAVMYHFADESFVEVVDKSTFYKVRNCRVNPLLHRLSIKIAENELGLEILRNFDGKSNGANTQTSPRRHRVINCSRDIKFNQYNSTINVDKNLASLIFHGGGAYLDNANWKRFELLNILDLEDFGLKILSETIGTSLIELKYLGLRNNYIQDIPRSLGWLKKLEVLDISQNFMVEVPNIIWQMDSLECLYMSDVICGKPLKMDTLEHLKTLTYISVYDFLGLERSMTNLKRLGIEEVDENSDVRKLIASLSESSISRLTLKGFRFKSMPCLDEVGLLGELRTLKLDGLLTRLPIFPPNIRKLSLVNSCLDEDPMPILGKIPHLRHLKLQNAYTGPQMVILKQYGFFDLEILRIKELWNLRHLQVAEYSMSRLRLLEIDNCPYLDTLPEEIWQMRCMKELKMVTTKNIATEIKKSGLIPKSMGVDISP